MRTGQRSSWTTRFQRRSRSLSACLILVTPVELCESVLRVADRDLMYLSSDVSSVPRTPAIPESLEPIQGGAREQKITPFDVEGGVDEEGKSLGM